MTTLRSTWLDKIKHYLSTVQKKVQASPYRHLISLFFFLLAAAAIGQIIYSNWETFQTFDWQINLPWLIAILIFFLIDLIVATWAWHQLTIKLANFNNFRKSAKICWSANLARRIPGPIWYIAGRALMYEQEGVSKRTTSMLSGLELAFFLISGLFTTILTLPFWVLPEQIATQQTQFIFVLILVPCTALFAHPKLLKSIWQRFSKENLTQDLTWKDTTTWIVNYVLAWLFGAFVFYSTINFVYPLPISELPQIIGIWSLAGAISLAGSLTISVIGLREISLALLLGPLLPPPIVLIVAIGIRIVWVIGEFLSALIAQFL
ncbi:MAG: hypothetical protein AAF490_16780 [Chloroflexota bacterium]